jgi:NAD-dependent deacetylase
MDARSDGLGRLTELLARSSRTVALTGAGMSTESGLPDYRGLDGLWRNRRFEELASLPMWRAHPAEFWAFYAERLRALDDAAPNPGHRALAALEHDGLVSLVVTQNVDGLHQAAGSRAVHEAHGSLREVECLTCGWRGPAAVAHEQLDRGAPAPLCPTCEAILKPAVVLFGELLSPAFLDVAEEVERCDLLLCCGTSLQVPPVALLPSRALRAGAALAIVNVGPTSCDEVADVRLEGLTGEVLPTLVARIAEQSA